MLPVTANGIESRMMNVFGDALEVHVEQHENQRQGDWHHQFEAFAHAEHVFVLPGPLEPIARGQQPGLLDFLRHKLFSLVDVAADVAADHVHIDPASEGAVFIANDRRAAGGMDVHQLAEGDLLKRRSRLAATRRSPIRRHWPIAATRPAMRT